MRIPTMNVLMLNASGDEEVPAVINVEDFDPDIHMKVDDADETVDPDGDDKESPWDEGFDISSATKAEMVEEHSRLVDEGLITEVDDFDGKKADEMRVALAAAVNEASVDEE